MSDMNPLSSHSSQPPVYRSFEDLEAYKAAREFRKAMYQVAKRLPDFEKFGLASQVRRAAVSLTNNLAEGHGRFHFLDQIKFTLISRGSLEELIDDLNICSDEAFLPAQEITILKATAWQILKLTNGYLRYLRDRKVGASLELRETPQPYRVGIADDESMEWLEEFLEQYPELMSSPKRSPDH